MGIYKIYVCPYPQNSKKTRIYLKIRADFLYVKKLLDNTRVFNKNTGIIMYLFSI